MPRLLLPFALLCALLTSGYPAVAAGLGAAHPANAATKPQPTTHVMIQLAGSPLTLDRNLKARDRFTAYHLRIDPTLPTARAYRTQLSRYQQEEISYLRSQGIQLHVGRTFGVVWNGFDAIVPSSQVAKLRSLRNIAAVLPTHTYYALDDHSLPLIHAPAAWSLLGGGPSAGRGEMIANIDTGIDVSNPCFSDKGMTPPPYGRRSDTSDNLQYTNNKVIVARAFGSNPTQDYSAQDQQGHGTFTAAIEACDYNTSTPLGSRMSGVAPAAYLLSYNVFPGSDGTTSDSQILSALDSALLDGADVINMSLGGTAGELRFDVEAAGVSNAIKGGVPVVVSAGNAGPTAQSIASPASDPDAISVGAVSNSQGVYSTISITGTDVPTGLQTLRATQGSHPFTGAIGPAQMVYVGLGRLPHDDPNDPTANDFAGKDLHGKIAVIERGISFFETKIDNAQKAGAIGVIVYDNRQEVSFAMDVQSATLPAMSIDQQSGQQLIAYLQSHPDAEATMHSAVTVFQKTPDILSYFSSRGYGQNFAIKPDLVAPGQDIYSATESEVSNNELYNPSGFASGDGTSFSAPHVAGAVALVLQRHPKWTPAQVKEALAETADASIYLNQNRTGTPSVMDDGSGMLDVESALNTPVLVEPSSLSFGGVNGAYGAVQRDSTLTFSDMGGGSGTWQVTVQPLSASSGVSVTAPATVSLAANGHVDIPVHLAVASSTPSGDDDGNIVLTRGSDVLHVPYFVHVATLAITKGSVLLVDDSTSHFVVEDPLAPPIVHHDVSAYFENALHDIGKTYTYWDEGKLGPPALSDLKRASAVVFFTGDNLNGFAAQNSDPQSHVPPLGPTDDSVLQSYIDSGGRVFLTGMGAALSDPYFTAIEFGGYASSLSLYDTTTNDKPAKGGISPPKPSLKPVLGKKGAIAKTGIFAGMKPFDISTAGDGAKDNLAVDSQDLGLVGVPGLNYIRGSFDPGIHIFGEPILITTNTNITQGPIDGNYAATDSSDEPSFTHTVRHTGRSVFFSFGFEGINNNTGYATRDQVMARIFQWFDDHPSASVVPAHYPTGKQVQLRATFHAKARAGVYTWQINGKVLKPSVGPTKYRFPHRGAYRVRVEITDLLGHVGVSRWQQITVG